MQNQIKAQGQSIFILIGMLVAIIAIVHCQGWKMTQTLGELMFALYFLFLVQAILTEYFMNPGFGYSDLNKQRRRSLAVLR